MFGVDPESISVEQVEDALGELANMTGGNFKSLVPGPSVLSLPRVSLIGGGGTAKATERVLGRFGFLCLDLPFLITVSTAEIRE